MIKPRESIAKMSQYKPPVENRKGKLRLDFNENTLGCSPCVIRALRRITSRELAVYPEYSMIRRKLADYLKVEPSEVVLTNGTDEAIRLIMETYLEKDDKIIIPEPTFAMFRVNAEVIGAKISSVLYKKDLSFPAKDILDKITDKTKMIVLVNPNNPTGTCIEESEMKDIIEKGKDSVIIIDEAYYQFYGKSAKSWINRYGNIFVTQTFSKEFGLAGLRIGYIISNKENIGYLQKVISPYSVNSLAVIAASAALDDIKYVKRYVKEIKKSKLYLEDQLKRLGLNIFPSKANFVLADFGEDCSDICRGLEEKNILIRNRSSDPLLKGFARITVGTKEQSKILVNALKEILKPALIFDMDGVLVDVSNSYRAAIKKTAEFFTNSEVTYEEIQSYKEKVGFNNDWDLTEAIILSRNKKIEKSEIIGKFQSYYLGNKFDGLINNEGWLLDKSLLKNLSRRYKLSIVTGRPKIEAEYALKSNGVDKFFPDLIALENVSKDKPDPEGILKTLAKLKTNNAVYFGDTKNDELAAYKAKIDFVLIKNNTNKILERYIR